MTDDFDQWTAEMYAHIVTVADEQMQIIDAGGFCQDRHLTLVGWLRFTDRTPEDAR